MTPTTKLWVRRIAAVRDAFRRFYQRHEGFFAGSLIVGAIVIFGAIVVWMFSAMVDAGKVTDEKLQKAAVRPCVRQKMADHLTTGKKIMMYDLDRFDRECTEVETIENQLKAIKK